MSEVEPGAVEASTGAAATHPTDGTSSTVFPSLPPSAPSPPPVVTEEQKRCRCCFQFRPLSDLHAHPIGSSVGLPPHSLCSACLEIYNAVGQWKWKTNPLTKKDEFCRLCGEGNLGTVSCDSETMRPPVAAQTTTSNSSRNSGRNTSATSSSSSSSPPCARSFCEGCILANWGRQRYNRILDLADKSVWECFVCTQTACAQGGLTRDGLAKCPVPWYNVPRTHLHLSARAAVGGFSKRTMVDAYDIKRFVPGFSYFDQGKVRQIKRAIRGKGDKNKERKKLAETTTSAETTAASAAASTPSAAFSSSHVVLSSPSSSSGSSSSSECSDLEIFANCDIDRVRVPLQPSFDYRRDPAQAAAIAATAAAAAAAAAAAGASGTPSTSSTCLPPSPFSESFLSSIAQSASPASLGSLHDLGPDDELDEDEDRPRPMELVKFVQETRNRKRRKERQKRREAKERAKQAQLKKEMNDTNTNDQTTPSNNLPKQEIKDEQNQKTEAVDMDEGKDVAASAASSTTIAPLPRTVTPAFPFAPRFTAPSSPSASAHCPTVKILSYCFFLHELHLASNHTPYLFGLLENLARIHRDWSRDGWIARIYYDDSLVPPDPREVVGGAPPRGEGLVCKLGYQLRLCDVWSGLIMPHLKQCEMAGFLQLRRFNWPQFQDRDRIHHGSAATMARFMALGDLGLRVGEGMGRSEKGRFKHKAFAASPSCSSSNHGRLISQVVLVDVDNHLTVEAKKLIEGLEPGYFYREAHQRFHDPRYPVPLWAGGFSAKIPREAFIAVAHSDSAAEELSQGDNAAAHTNKTFADLPSLSLSPSWVNPYSRIESWIMSWGAAHCREPESIHQSSEMTWKGGADSQAGNGISAVAPGPGESPGGNHLKYKGEDPKLERKREREEIERKREWQRAENGAIGVTEDNLQELLRVSNTSSSNHTATAVGGSNSKSKQHGERKQPGRGTKTAASASSPSDLLYDDIDSTPPASAPSRRSVSNASAKSQSPPSSGSGSSLPFGLTTPTPSSRPVPMEIEGEEKEGVPHNSEEEHKQSRRPPTATATASAAAVAAAAEKRRSSRGHLSTLAYEKTQQQQMKQLEQMQASKSTAGYDSEDAEECKAPTKPVSLAPVASSSAPDAGDDDCVEIFPPDTTHAAASSSNATATDAAASKETTSRSSRSARAGNQGQVKREPGSSSTRGSRGTASSSSSSSSRPPLPHEQHIDPTRPDAPPAEFNLEFFPYGCDQVFLADKVWPIVQKDVHTTISLLPTAALAQDQKVWPPVLTAEQRAMLLSADARWYWSFMEWMPNRLRPKPLGIAAFVRGFIARKWGDMLKQARETVERIKAGRMNSVSHIPLKQWNDMLHSGQMEVPHPLKVVSPPPSPPLSQDEDAEEQEDDDLEEIASVPSNRATPRSGGAGKDSAIVKKSHKRKLPPLPTSTEQASNPSKSKRKKESSSPVRQSTPSSSSSKRKLQLGDQSVKKAPLAHRSSSSRSASSTTTVIGPSNGGDADDDSSSCSSSLSLDNDEPLDVAAMQRLSGIVDMRDEDSSEDERPEGQEHKAQEQTKRPHVKAEPTSLPKKANVVSSAEQVSSYNRKRKATSFFTPSASSTTATPSSASAGGVAMTTAQFDNFHFQEECEWGCEFLHGARICQTTRSVNTAKPIPVAEIQAPTQPPFQPLTQEPTQIEDVNMTTPAELAPVPNRPQCAIHAELMQEASDSLKLALQPRVVVPVAAVTPIRATTLDAAASTLSSNKSDESMELTAASAHPSDPSQPATSEESTTSGTGTEAAKVNVAPDASSTSTANATAATAASDPIIPAASAPAVATAKDPASSSVEDVGPAAAEDAATSFSGTSTSALAAAEPAAVTTDPSPSLPSAVSESTDADACSSSSSSVSDAVAAPVPFLVSGRVARSKMTPKPLHDFVLQENTSVPRSSGISGGSRMAGEGLAGGALPVKMRVVCTCQCNFCAPPLFSLESYSHSSSGSSSRAVPLFHPSFPAVPWPWPRETMQSWLCSLAESFLPLSAFIEEARVPILRRQPKSSGDAGSAAGSASSSSSPPSSDVIVVSGSVSGPRPSQPLSHMEQLFNLHPTRLIKIINKARQTFGVSGVSSPSLLAYSLHQKLTALKQEIRQIQNKNRQRHSNM